MIDLRLPTDGTSRLRFDPFVRADLGDLASLLGDPRVMAHSPSGALDRDSVERWLARVLGGYDTHGLGFVALRDRVDGRYVGHVGLLPQRVDDREELEVAYWIKLEAQGRGLATEAALACRDHAIDTLGRSRLVSLIVPENLPSQRVAARLGMRAERRTRWRDVEIDVWSLEVT